MPFVTPEPTDYATAKHKADHVALEAASGSGVAKSVVTDSVEYWQAATLPADNTGLTPFSSTAWNQNSVNPSPGLTANSNGTFTVVTPGIWTITFQIGPSGAGQPTTAWVQGQMGFSTIPTASWQEFASVPGTPNGWLNTGAFTYFLPVNEIISINAISSGLTGTLRMFIDLVFALVRPA